MGLFWDIYQQSQISEQRATSQSLEQEVASLRSEVERQRDLLRAVIERLEKHVGVDLDQDGRVG